jgi:hypothetical protein
VSHFIFTIAGARTVCWGGSRKGAFLHFVTPRFVRGSRVKEVAYASPPLGRTFREGLADVGASFLFFTTLRKFELFNPASKDTVAQF